MRESLQTLLANVIDYAGLFPPAMLLLEQAMRNYAAYRGTLDAWMLGRFICPTWRLADLAPFHDELFVHGHPFVFSVIGRAGSTRSEFLAHLGDDLRDIAAFHDRHGPRVVVDVLETRLPADVVGQRSSTASLLAECAATIEKHGPPALKPFYECPLREHWRGEVEDTLAALAEDHRLALQEPRHRCHQAGFKLRCGGLEAAAFPASEQVAFVLVAARAHSIPLKMTAGLHHPIRHFEASVQANMHGFLNVLIAAVLSATHHLDEQTVCKIVDCTDAGQFTFANNWLGWQDLNAHEGEIGACRHGVLLSFGSCSFDEPRADLRSLHLL